MILRLLFVLMLLASASSVSARTAAFRVWMQSPADSVRWNLYDSSAVSQTGLATLDSSNYFAYWNVVIDDTTTYSLQATYWRTGMRQVSACIPLQLVYTDAIDSLKYALWLPQPIDSLRWTTRSATGTAHTGLANVDSSDYYVWWMVPVDSANRYLHNANFWWDGATRPVSDIENLIPYGSGSSSGFTITDSTAIARWVWTLFDERNVTGGWAGIGYTYRINVLDTSAAPDAVVPGLTLYANNLAQSSFNWTARTDIYGNAYFGLDTGTYIIYTTNPAYWPNIDTIVVSDTGSYVFRQRAAVSTNLASFTTPVSFSLTKPDATPNDSARINIELVSANDSLLRLNNIIVAASYRQMIVRTDINGLCVVGLFPNAYFANDSSYYRVTIRNKVGETIVEEYLTRIPISDTTQAAALLPRWEEE